MVYIAADNDLDAFLERNIKQMVRFGSTENVDIVIQVNKVEKKYRQKLSKTIYIEKGNAKILKKTTQPNATDSGNAQTLIDFCCETIKQFPAEHYALILWDHGTGPLDPYCRTRFAVSEMFSFDDEYLSTNQLASPFFDLKFSATSNKGVCFDDTTGNFLTEQNLAEALETICTDALESNSFDLIGFDACLMAMVEIASNVAPYANFMVGSQEVELGTGWDYGRVLSLFKEKIPTPKELGIHIVKTYKKTYQFTDDYTFSCLDLQHIPLLEQLIEQLALLLQKGCHKSFPSIKEAIRMSRYKHFCTHFDEPDFIDLKHFIKNLHKNSSSIFFMSEKSTNEFKETLHSLITNITTQLRLLIIKNNAGNFFDLACGLSIYFPEQFVHRSYRANKFAQTTQWLSFLRSYFS